MNQTAAQAGAEPAAGVAYLRNLTLRRATREYVDWIGKSVGWWTILYLLFWMVVFAISGIELLGRLDEPLPIPIGVPIATTFTFIFGSLIYRARAAPVHVNRRDVYRLVLSGVQPFAVLRWPFIKRWATLGFIGLALGTVFAVVAPYWLHYHAWFAGPGLALILISHLNLTWIRYNQWGNPDADLRTIILLPVATAFSLIGVFLPTIGLTAAFNSNSPLSLFLPLLLAVGSSYVVHRTLERSYPPRFAAQSFVLSELSAMRQLNLIAGMAGIPADFDPAYRARLLATLHDKPGVTKPSRSIRPPRPGAPQFQAIAWRTFSMLYRRHLGAQLRLVVQFAATVAVIYFAPLAGSFGLLLAALVMSNLAAFTLGVGGYPRHYPLSAWHRTIGRVIPAGILAVLAAVVADVLAVTLGGAPAPVPGDLILTASMLLSAVLWLEKYSSWTGAPPRRMEPWIVAALLASAPVLLLTAFGAPGLVLPVQLGIMVLLLLLDA